jgi:hypothetical protein
MDRPAESYEMKAVVPPLRIRGRKWLMKDGLYLVRSEKRSCWAGRTGCFLIWRGRCTRMTPNLRHEFQMWAHRAEYLGEPWRFKVAYLATE